MSERSKTQARDKYLVTNISGDSCTVRKFTRNQFRRKDYSVPLTGVYPIVGSTFAPPVVHESSSSSDSDDGAPQDANVGLAAVKSSSEGEDGGVEVEDVQCVAENARPRRDTKPPAWHRDYVMD